MHRLYPFTWILICTLFSTSSLISICPSGITAIAYFDTNTKDPAQLQENLASTVKMGLDYIAIDLAVTEKDNTTLLDNALFNQIEPVDDLGVSKREFPSTFAPQLQEILKNPLQNMGVVIVINPETHPSDLFIKTLAEMVNQYNKTKKGYPVIVGTFSPEIALYLKRYFPELPFAAFADNATNLFNFQKYEPKIYALSTALATEALITQLNNESRGVWIFTVNDPHEMETFAHQGAIGILTKEAQNLLKFKDKLKKECLNLINK